MFTVSIIVGKVTRVLVGGPRFVIGKDALGSYHATVSDVLCMKCVMAIFILKERTKKIKTS